MRKLRLPVALLTLSLLCVSGCFLFLGAQAFTTFLPPRTAVVDISKIFDSYQKQIDKSGELKVVFDKAKRLMDALKENIEIKEEELKSIKQDSPGYARIFSELLESRRKFREGQKKHGEDIAKRQAAVDGPIVGQDLSRRTNVEIGFRVPLVRGKKLGGHPNSRRITNQFIARKPADTHTFAPLTFE